ncbi:hypothetical protein Clacol_010076 [Clathrus columnatus]|uniref:Peptidase A1 domain-containing protein n=1 Tax=Clathrus columnatus TaxID=1419009 RepID=A0AAV5AQM1_9AGAM|nr:hypothetical protein Clacol_010076 [Clathrus columnatus]
MANPSRSIIINNTDSRITYEPANAWVDTPSTDPAFQTGSLGPPFATSLKTVFQDGNFTFSFNGSSIQVYGSVDIINGSQPTFSCTIDGTVITTGIPKFPQNNWDMCDSGNLEIGQHVLGFNVQSQESLFFFDHITFLPSTDDQLGNGLIRIDFSDSSINYLGNWTSPEGLGSQLTNDHGSFVKMPFIGQQLTWYGVFSTSFPFESAPAEFSVDGGTPVQFELGGLINNGPFTAPLANQLLFQTGELPQGPHEVIVTYLGNEEQTDLSLSYVIVQNSSLPADNHSAPTQTMKPATQGTFALTKISTSIIPTQAISTNSSSLSNQPTSSTSTTSHTFISSTVTTFIKSTPSATTNSPQSDSSRLPLIDVGIIVGIILLLLIVIMLTVVFIIKRLNKKHAAKLKSAIKQTMSTNLTGTLPLPLASSNNDDESTLLCRGPTIRTATSDSLDGYVTPPSFRTSSFDSTRNLFNMPRTRVASHVPILPTLLDPFVFRVEDSRTSGTFSLISNGTNAPHSRIIRPLSSLQVMPDGNLNPGVDDGTASAGGIGGGDDIESSPHTEQHEDSGIRLGKQMALQYEESSSSKGSPPIYTRI